MYESGGTQSVTASLALDDRIETAMFAYPFSAGWVDSRDVSLLPYRSPSQTGDAALALLDSIAALTLLETHVIVRDIAVVTRHASMLTMETHTRPDEVDEASIAIPGISPAGRAVATAVIQPFYGIRVSAWSEQDHAVDAAHARITEGAAALIPVEDEEQYQEDLGRAWFLMTDRPFVSHVAVAPRALLVSNPATVAQAVARLNGAREVASERGRELRRDLSKGLNIDRETLTETLADQSFSLDDLAVDGLADLARRSGFAVSKKDLRAALVTIQQAQG
jgi:predicted solute-binding protein